MLEKVDSMLLYVSDTQVSADFYKLLGFEVKTGEDSATASLNGFEIQCFDKTKTEFKSDSDMDPKGVGVFIYIKVEGIDGYHKGLKEKGLNPSHDPKDWPWGRREFALKDPDGYRLVFYETVKSKK